MRLFVCKKTLSQRPRVTRIDYFSFKNANGIGGCLSLI